MDPDQARAELARRELARRQSAQGFTPPQQPEAPKPSLFDSMKTNLTQRSTRPTGLLGLAGVGLSAAGIPEESALPIMGQTVGMMGGIPGEMAGAAIGQGARQFVKKTLRGEDVTPLGAAGAMAGDAAITGTVGGLAKGAGNIVFRKQIFNKALEGVSSKLNDMKDIIASNPALKTTSQPFLDHIEGAYNALPEAMRTGSTATRLTNWIKTLKSSPDISAKDLILMEEDLGKASKFGEVSKGVFMPATEIPNTATNAIAKSSRAMASDAVDELANQGGETGFSQTSQDLSKMLSKKAANNPTKAGSSAIAELARLGLAGAVGVSSHSPGLGVGTYLAERALRSPELRNGLFNIVQNPVSIAAGRAMRLGGTQALRSMKK